MPSFASFKAWNVHYAWLHIFVGLTSACWANTCRMNECTVRSQERIQRMWLALSRSRKRQLTLIYYHNLHHEFNHIEIRVSFALFIWHGGFQIFDVSLFYIFTRTRLLVAKKCIWYEGIAPIYTVVYIICRQYRLRLLASN